MERELDMMTTPQDDFWFEEVQLTEAEEKALMRVPLYYRIWLWMGKLVKGLFKALAFLIMTPFFLLIWLRNCLILSISFPIIFTLLSMLYYTFTNPSIINSANINQMSAVIFVEWKVWILIGSIIIVGLCAAIYDFKDKFLDIWHL